MYLKVCCGLPDPMYGESPKSFSYSFLAFSCFFLLSSPFTPSSSPWKLMACFHSGNQQEKERKQKIKNSWRHFAFPLGFKLWYSLSVIFFLPSILSLKCSFHQDKKKVKKKKRETDIAWNLKYKGHSRPPWSCLFFTLSFRLSQIFVPSNYLWLLLDSSSHSRHQCGRKFCCLTHVSFMYK